MNSKIFLVSEGFYGVEPPSSSLGSGEDLYQLDAKKKTAHFCACVPAGFLLFEPPGKENFRKTQMLKRTSIIFLPYLVSRNMPLEQTHTNDFTPRHCRDL